MTVEPWSPQKMTNIADTRSAFAGRPQRRRVELTAQSTVLAVTILSGSLPRRFFRQCVPSCPSLGRFRLVCAEPVQLIAGVIAMAGIWVINNLSRVALPSTWQLGSR